jgi:hypothetical protein
MQQPAQLSTRLCSAHSMHAASDAVMLQLVDLRAAARHAHSLLEPRMHDGVLARLGSRQALGSVKHCICCFSARRTRAHCHLLHLWLLEIAFATGEALAQGAFEPSKQSRHISVLSRKQAHPGRVRAWERRKHIFSCIELPRQAAATIFAPATCARCQRTAFGTLPERKRESVGGGQASSRG